MADCGCNIEATDDAQRTTLRWVLAINAIMFATEFTCGIFAESTGLVADSLDMLADASVYGISLYAVGRSVSTRQLAAAGSGLFQLVLGVGVLVESGRRFFYGGEPVGVTMIAMGSIALCANVICLALLAKHRHGDVNFRASWIFSTNDVIANLGVIVSGGLVLLTQSQYPDLVVGIIVAGAVVYGGVKILTEARNAKNHSGASI
ncbi:cation transporter [Botrimarina mediterranea]|uniref:cation transporter n=1 Tax=Botrimarina mediterranea TaxID=2528022 RepID=UPI00118A0AD7|nr:zinc transporter ZitB [Planctomycetes bacterium K2D]